MYDIPYCSLAFQYISLTATKKETKETKKLTEEEEEDKLIDFLSSL